MVYKKVTKSGAVTFPRAVRQETGILPGVPVDIVADEAGIHISKHVPACFRCGNVENVRKACGIEVCADCAREIWEAFT